jgi:NAD(P)H-dependent FMN reductase
MKILAFAASNSRSSINRVLIEHATARLTSDVLPGAEIEILDIDDFEMPIYSIDRENEEGIPTSARAFFDAIGVADAVLVSFAEHNGSVTAPWKNVFDWMSRIEMKLWQGKPLVMLAASPGPSAGAGVLGSQEMLAPRFGADSRGVLGVGKWPEAWDAERRELTNADDRAALDAALSSLVTGTPEPAAHAPARPADPTHAGKHPP